MKLLGNAKVFYSIGKIRNNYGPDIGFILKTRTKNYLTSLMAVINLHNKKISKNPCEYKHENH